MAVDSQQLQEVLRKNLSCEKVLLMPIVTLRKTADSDSASDIQVTIQDRTFDYLMTSEAAEIRVSAYLDQDIPQVEKTYEELFVQENCPFHSSISQIIPGSRTREVALPGEMKSGEQLVILVKRTLKNP